MGVRVGLVLAMAAGVFAAGAPAALADGGMDVDCDAATPLIQTGAGTECEYELGVPFGVQVHVTSAPAVPYVNGFQTKLAWEDVPIDYNPTALPDDEALWASCTIAARADNQPGGDPSVLFGCTPFPSAPGTFTGVVAQFELECKENGMSPLTLVPRAGDTQGGTVFLDAFTDPIDPVLTDAIPGVTCGTGVSPGPSAPTGLATTPVSPSSDDTPKLKGTVDATTTEVKLYTNQNCTEPPATLSTQIAVFEDVGINVSVTQNVTTDLSAKAVDASAAVSPCSGSIEYEHDSIAPDPPTVTGTDPASGSNDNSPMVIGTVVPSQGTTAVNVHKNQDCTGVWDSQGSIASFESGGIGVFVPDNSPTDLSAAAVDAAGNESNCSNSITYVEVTPPLPQPPSITATDPLSPANDNTPRVMGTAEAGNWVKLYAGDDCSGHPVAQGTAHSFASPGLPLKAAVPDNSATTFSATATAGAPSNQVSQCSSSSTTYVEDSTAPAPPAFTATDPLSPANDNTPRVMGTAEPGSTVKLYPNPGCSGSPLAQGSAASFASPGLAVAVGDNRTTTFHATAADPSGNVSACSASAIAYVEDSTSPAPAPPTPAVTDTIAPAVTVATKALTAARNGVVRVRLSCPASEPGGCMGTLALQTQSKVRVSTRGADASRKRKVKLGSKSFKIPGGRTRTVQVRLSKKNRRLVKRLRRVRVRATVKARDTAGNKRTTRKTLTLKATNGKRRR